MEKHIIHCVNNKHSSKFCRNLEWENYIFKSGSHIAKSHIWKAIWKKNKEHQRAPLGRLALVSGPLWSCLTFGPALRGVLSEGHTLLEHLSGWSFAGVRDTHVSGPSCSTVLSPSATTRSCLACTSLLPCTRQHLPAS